MKMVLTKHFMMTARLECTDRPPFLRFYFKSGACLLGWMDGGHTQTCLKKGEGPDGMWESGEISLSWDFPFFDQYIIIFVCKVFPLILNFGRSQLFRALCPRPWRKGASAFISWRRLSFERSTHLALRSI